MALCRSFALLVKALRWATTPNPRVRPMMVVMPDEAVARRPDPSPSAHLEPHKSGRSGWLRAAVLGASDGIVSIGALLAGVAAANSDLRTIMTAGAAAVAAGALSMASGEYVSVAAQRDAERSDTEQEASELERHPDRELKELTDIYVRRGVERELAGEVAKQLTAADALGAHLRDEVGITSTSAAKPMQAALVSASSFVVGALPLLSVVVLFDSTMARTVSIWVVCLTLLAVLGSVGAHIGGASRTRGTVRVVAGGVLALIVTTGVGAAVGTF